MKVKSVVKIMNFHSLLRVNSARKKAERLNEYEKELHSMIDTILNNRNFLLDKKSLIPPKDKKDLVIYIGNDYGFCSNFNTAVNDKLKHDKENDKILIGKKINANLATNVIKYMDKDSFYAGVADINNYLLDSLINFKYSNIKVVYNHYYNVNKLGLVEKVIFPIEPLSENQGKKYSDDFVVEGNINEILINLVSLYIGYEIEIAEASSWAAENVMRQLVTKESLDKIEKMEEEKETMIRKEKKNKAFKRIIENSNHIREREE